jgi:hypothetical protein
MLFQGRDAMYENIIITLILIAELISLNLALKAESRRHKARTNYRFNRILKSVGLR